MTQNVNSNMIGRSDVIIRCGETNKDDTGKYAVLDHLALQFMKRHYIIHKGETLHE